MSIIKFEKKEYQVVKSCEHNNISIDRANKQITCRDCGIELDPFDAIMGYSDALDDWAKRLDKYADDTKRDFARNQIVARRLENKKNQVPSLRRSDRYQDQRTNALGVS